MRHTLLAALILVLYVLHQDWWNWTSARPLLFGFLPIGLSYHAAFSIASSALMFLLVKLAWPGHLERLAGGGTASSLERDRLVEMPEPRD